MSFYSIVGVEKTKKLDPEDIVMPRFFYDLNLDQVVTEIFEQQKLYDIRRYFYEKVSKEDIRYRSEVLKDFDKTIVYQSVVDFSISMRKAKEYLSNIKDNQRKAQQHKWKLDAACHYVNGVVKLYQILSAQTLQSVGMREFVEWLKAFTLNEQFTTLRSDCQNLSNKFNEMKFNIQIKRDRVVIKQGYLEEDYGKQLQDTFSEQSQPEHYYQSNPFASIELSALEEAVLEVLKKPYEQTFSELAKFNDNYSDFIDETINEFELESQFYIAFRLYRENMKEMNYHFCYPEYTESKFCIKDGYDLALAKKNAVKKLPVVGNDCCFEPGEQFLVITGPNQGGKTTYARALGQILYFGSIGLMVPARSAAFPIMDGIYTHFATEESMETGAGKLKEELIRLKTMMDSVTENSFVIINEIFTSATSYDAYIMGKRVLEYFMKANCHGAYVTHIFELTKEDDRIISLVASLLSEDSNIRTFKINRKVADGRSFANTIVEKYHMTYDEIKERINQ